MVHRVKRFSEIQIDHVRLYIFIQVLSYGV